ncbi:MAG: acetate kinase [Endomicrobium sp.]|jgi:acetate kinase|nr:acetate kinase [Endomicrobium sp.]
MKILVVNCGSSSVKYALFEMEKEKKIAWGLIECIGLPEAFYRRQTVKSDEKKESVKIANHTEAVELMIEELLDEKSGSILNIKEIAVVGHRVVHGGDKFFETVLVNDKVKEDLKNSFSIAPLHNPAHYAGIIAIEKMLPSIPSVLVFDTAFYHTMPDYAYVYALPYEFYEKDHIRKYGFHGTSHNYVSQKAAKMLKKSLNEVNLITAHLGNGSSITAIEKGNVIDTSMGFTPLEGVIMGTRCGSIDPAIIAYLLDKYPTYKDSSVLNDMLNKKSGLAGISGLSGDMRTIVQAVNDGNRKAMLAFEMFIYSIKRYIGAYYGILNGIDALIFTAGIGENSAFIREAVCKNFCALGIEIDKEKNYEHCTYERFISTKNSRVKVMIIPTNEELMIAREAKKRLTSK